MRRHWISASPDTRVAEAAQLMRLARVRHLPVVGGGILRGLVSYTDLLMACADGTTAAGGELCVRDVMSLGSEVAEPAMPLAEVARRMVRGAVGCLPVVEPTPQGPRLLGLVTESDLLRAAYEPWLDPSAG